MGWIETLFVFAFGAAIGSFLNVCVARLPAGVSIVKPGSRCPRCEQPIAWYDNLPILSYLLLAGRCRHCRSQISKVYPLVELLTAVLAVGVARRFQVGVVFGAYFAFAAALVVITFIDLKHQIIPDVISLPGIALGFAVSFISPVTDPVSSVAGIILGGGFLGTVAVLGQWWYKREAMGWGDVKLLAMIGAFLGWRYLPLTILVSSLGGSMIGIAVMLYTGADRKLAIPFGPYLALGALVSLLWGDWLISWYMGTI